MNKFNILLADDTPEVIDDFEQWLQAIKFLKNRVNFLKTPYIKKVSDFDDIYSFDKIDFKQNRIDIAIVDLMWDRPEDFFGKNDSGGRHIVQKLEDAYKGKCLIVIVSHKQNDLTEPIFLCNGKTYPALPKVNISQEQKESLFLKYLTAWQKDRIRNLNNKTKWRKLLYSIQDSNYIDSIEDENGIEWNINDFLLVSDDVPFRHQEQLKEIKDLLDYYKGPTSGAKWKNLEGDFWKKYHQLAKIEFHSSTMPNGQHFNLLSKVETKLIAWRGLIDNVLNGIEPKVSNTVNWLATSDLPDDISIINKLVWRLLILEIYQKSESILNKNAPSEYESKLLKLRNLDLIFQIHEYCAPDFTKQYIFKKDITAKASDKLSSTAKKLFSTSLGFQHQTLFLKQPASEELFPHEVEYLNKL